MGKGATYLRMIRQRQRECNRVHIVTRDSSVSWPTWFKCARDRSSRRRFMFCSVRRQPPSISQASKGCVERERERIVVYKRTSHPSNIETWSPIVNMTH